jgi:hypothetical protein
MQHKGSFGSFDECEDRKTQRAVLAFLLDEFPAKHTQETLRWRGFGDASARAIRVLDVVDLLWCEGEVMMPTAAARHFNWLELS